jgi:hypothetical protein
MQPRAGAVRIVGIGIAQQVASRPRSFDCPGSSAMSLAAATLKATGAIAVMCFVLAVSTIWLVLSDPVAVATAVNTGDLSSVYTLVSSALADVLRSVLRYL